MGEHSEVSYEEDDNSDEDVFLASYVRRDDLISRQTKLAVEYTEFESDSAIRYLRQKSDYEPSEDNTRSDNDQIITI